MKDNNSVCFIFLNFHSQPETVLLPCERANCDESYDEVVGGYSGEEGGLAEFNIILISE